MPRPCSSAVTTFLIWVVTNHLSAAADLPKLRIEGPVLVETPIVVEVKSGVPPGTYKIVRGDELVEPVAVFEEGSKTFLATILPKGQKSETLSIREVALEGKAGSGVILFGSPRLEIQVDGRLVTEYIPNDGPKPYFFPLIGPSNAKLTRAFPMQKNVGEKVDHPHHRSLWFTHGSVNKVDFWSELPGHGTIVETSRSTISGMVLGRLRTTDDWIGPDGKKVCEDERVVTFYRSNHNQIIDFDVTLKATVGPVTFGDTKEGMFGLRVATSMDVTSKKGGKITNAEGVTDQKAWGKASPWVDYTGPVDGKTVGIAILNHPTSFRYPTTWHVRDYGLFAANPFGYHDFGQKNSGEYRLPAGESIEFRYRLILHDGDTASADLPAAFQAYEAPPVLTIQ